MPYVSVVTKVENVSPNPSDCLLVGRIYKSKQAILTMGQSVLGLSVEECLNRRHAKAITKYKISIR